MFGLPGAVCAYEKASGGGTVGTLPTVARTGHNDGKGNAASSVTVAVSPAAALGKVLYFIAISSTGTLNAPAGFTEIKSGSTAVKLFRLIAGASEPTSYAFGFAGAVKGDTCAVTWIEIAGANGTSPENASAATTNTPTSPAVTTTQTNCLIVTLGGSSVSSDYSTQPTGYTLDIQNDTNLNGDTGIAHNSTVAASVGIVPSAAWNAGSYTTAKVFSVAVAS